jgi:hypothetical protein
MSNDKPGKPDDKIVIHVDQTKFDANKPEMTGAELRSLAGVAENRTLWREIPGVDDDLVDDSELVTLKTGMHFYTVAKTVNPG